MSAYRYLFSLRRWLLLFGWLGFILPARSLLAVVVPVYVSSDSSIYEEALMGMETVIQAETEILYLDILEAQYGDLESYFKQLSSREVPITIAFGLRAARTVRQYLPQSTLVFSMVSSPKTLDLSSGDICGVSMDLPIADFFDTLREIDPQARQVVALHSPAGTDTALEGSYYDLRYGLLYIPVRVETLDQFARRLQESAGGAQAIFMPPDPLYTKTNFELLSRYALENKKILMTGFTSLLELGATFALTPDYARIGIQTAELYHRVATGQSRCRDELVRLPEEKSLYVNENYARLQGIELPEAIVRRARNTRLFGVGVTMLREEKINAARKIFEMILEQDPENKSALLYLEIILEKQTGHRTRQLLAEADSYMQQRKYALARLKYAEVLKLNSKNEAAKAGINKAIWELSEEFRRDGEYKARAGRNFDAIRAYLESLKVLASNQRAKSELAALRSLEAKKIPGYMEEGSEAYNNRDYDKAILLFDNVLLIDPAHRQAQEYLRLSRQKKDAAERLLRQQRGGT